MEKKIILFIFMIITLVNLNFVFAQNLISSNFHGIIVPEFMISGNTSRLPVVFRAEISGLKPNSVYRYYNQMSSFADIGKPTSGAGNPVFIDTSFSYTSNPGLNTAGQYSQFTTGANGSYTGWFSVVNTTNTRFTHGNFLYPTIVVNNGSGGTAVSARYALDDSIKVMAFGSTGGSDYVTGIYGHSGAQAKNIIMLYDNIAGTGKPMSSAYTENENLSISNVPAFYSSDVDNINGAWGTFIPNDNSSGLRKIELYSLTSGNEIACSTDDDGIWPAGLINTINPAGGTTALSVNITDAPLSNCLSDLQITPVLNGRSLIKQGENRAEIYGLAFYPNIVDAVLDTLFLNLSGSYCISDIKRNGFKLWYSSDSLFDNSDSLIDSISISPGKLYFPLSYNLTVHHKYYFFLSLDIDETANPGDSVFVKAIKFSDIKTGDCIKSGADPLPGGNAVTVELSHIPALKAMPLKNFGRVIKGNNSAIQSFGIKGSNLFPLNDSVKISAPPGFLVSADSNHSFNLFGLKIPYSNGRLDTTVFVIFNPSSVKTYNDSIFVTTKYISTRLIISGTAVYPDTIPPKADTAFAVSLTAVKVKFDEAVDSTAEIGLNYSGLNSIISAKRLPSLDTVILILGSPLKKGYQKTLTISNISDTSGNHNVMKQARSFVIQIGEIPDYKIINIKSNDSNGEPDSADVVCRLRGVVESINFSEKGLEFFIHDGTAGIKVYKDSDFKIPYNVRMGDSISVTGIIGGYHGLTEIFSDSIKLLDSFKVTRQPVISNKIDESTESEIIKLTGIELINQAEWPAVAGERKDVHATDKKDTFIIRIEKLCELQGTPAPAGDFCITGIGSQYDPGLPYDSGYFILPRLISDLALYTGINLNNTENKIKLYPDPNQGDFILENDFIEKSDIEIYDVCGSLLNQLIISQNKYEIRTGLKAGFYFIKVGKTVNHNDIILKVLINQK